MLQPPVGSLDPHLLRGRRILVVEDDCVVAMDLEEALAAAGAIVVGPVPELARAFEALETEAPEAAILDVRLRGETVYPLIDRLRERGLAFLLVSGMETEDMPPDYADAPFCAKPFDIHDAIATLGELLTR